jgi:hypothetical protein
VNRNGQEPAPLWTSQYLTDGRLVITRSPRRRPSPNAWQAELDSVRKSFVLARDFLVRQDWLDWCGRQWIALTSTQKWWIVVLSILFTGGVALLLPLAGVPVHQYRTSHGRPTPRVPYVVDPTSPEMALAGWDTPEARVAAAASRAWLATVREPAWQSAFLARSRAAFDGQREVDQIIDVALRIRAIRLDMGMRPSGPAAAALWERQFQALEAVAFQLGNRADALIRYRDQTAALSQELQELAALERLQRSATAVDELSIETAGYVERRDERILDVADQIIGVRQAMTDIVDLMTRTRAPLDSPPTMPPLTL